MTTHKYYSAEELRRSEERFRLAIAALREHAFYMLDVEGNVQSWNPGAERNKGYTAQEIIGQHFSVFFTEDDRVSGKPMRELHVARQMGSFEEEGWRVRKDGTRFWAAIVITAVHDSAGNLRGFVKVTRDETAKHEASMQLQKALERARLAEAASRQHAIELEKRVAERTELLTKQTEKLTRTNVELEQFAFIASHDLKEPLRMITSYLDLLRERYGSRFDERASNYLSRVVAAADRMRELVEAVLEYSRTDEGLASLEVVPLAEVVRIAIGNQASTVEQVGAQVAVEPLPTIRANRLHLVRVFQNLIANAIKFRSERPLQIRISAEAVGNEWVISVADNGIGIDDRMRTRLFKIFQRLHATDEYPGTGIGLATCKKIVERHGGRIWVDTGPEHGSIFRMALPKEP
jgi:PAS domain S-box-containing protein